MEEVNKRRRTLSLSLMSSSYFFLFFEPIPIFSYFLTKTSYFSYFLACEAQICNKIENEIIVVCVLECDLS